MAHIVARGERIEVADHLIGLTHVLAQDAHEVPVHRAALGELHDRDLDAFLIDGLAVRAETTPAHIHHMGGAGEEATSSPSRKDGDTMVMSCRCPVPFHGSLVT